MKSKIFVKTPASALVLISGLLLSSVFSSTAIASRSGTLKSAAGSIQHQSLQTQHRTINVNGLDIFYREAGSANAPTILLLHGFPTSSHMFRNLIPALADRFHVVAPDYPGFGNSSRPDVKYF